MAKKIERFFVRFVRAIEKAQQARANAVIKAHQLGGSGF